MSRETLAEVLAGHDSRYVTEWRCTCGVLLTYDTVLERETYRAHLADVLADHVRAKQAEAVASVAWEIASSTSLRLGHNVSVVCSCLRCEVAQGAARIASDRADRLRDGA